MAQQSESVSTTETVDPCQNYFSAEACTVMEGYGEFLALIFAIVIALFGALAGIRIRWIDQANKRRTARYWVFYNASNRISQDRNTLWYFEEFYPGLEPNRPAPLRETLVRPTSVLSRHTSRIVEGFTNTWVNDDILNQAMAFEFSLLNEVEKSTILAYFEHYNTLEDRVSMISPFLIKTDPAADRVISAAIDSNELNFSESDHSFEKFAAWALAELRKEHIEDEEKIRPVLKEQLQEIVKTVKKLIAEAICLMEIIWLFDPTIGYNQIKNARIALSEYDIEYKDAYEELSDRIKNSQKPFSISGKFRVWCLRWSINRRVQALSRRIKDAEDRVAKKRNGEAGSEALFNESLAIRHSKS